MSAIYSAMVDPGVAFDPAVHNREDLLIVSCDLEHVEGSKPTIKVTVKNPQVGLLRPGRKVNLWLSWYNTSLSAIEPLFYGRLVGIPTSLLGQKVELTFIADPVDYLQQKQAIAELKKHRPNYDPLFLDPAHRDDPDAILEGYTELWHIDRVTHAVTTSDIITGEDGILVFDQGEALYDSVTMEISSAPLTIVQVEAQVQWTQKFSGDLDLAAATYESMNGDAIISDWPQPGASLGGGWSVASSTVIDANGTSTATTVQGGFEFTDKSKQHNDGDTIHAKWQWSVPQGRTFQDAILTSWDSQPGFLDANAVDVNGDPSPTNIPPHFNGSYSWAMPWKVAAGALGLRYDAERARTERLVFTMTADLQEITTVQDVPTNTEIISLQGANVDLPLLDFDIWSTIAGQAIEQDTVIRVPTSLSPLILHENYQICITAGTAGTTEPAFSDQVGVLTHDGSVVWAGLGTSPPTTLDTWSANDSIPAGTVLQPKAQIAVPYNDLVAFYPTPATGTSIALNKIIHTPDGASYQICISAGVTGLTAPTFNNTLGTTTTDGSVTWRSLGPTLIDGTTQWLALNNGTTGTNIPAFTGPAGTTITDGSVTWRSLGTVGSFIGIPIGDTSRNNYFPSDRGLWSLEYALCVGRAHLLSKARCVKITFECPAERITGLSCRKSAQLFDFRLPGGQAIGKITRYTWSADGSSGKIRCLVEFECPIGKANQISPGVGTADYIEVDYIEDGYYEHLGTVIQVAAGPGDIGYTPPVSTGADDGLIFPLVLADAVIIDEMRGTAFPDLTDAIKSDNTPPPPALPGQQQTPQPTGAVTRTIQADPYHRHIELRPVTGQNFDDEYDITTTSLVVPMGIDLSAAPIT